MLTEWSEQLAAELQVDDDLPADDDLVDTILDVARVAAHAVERPAAPLTTFLVGYAAARRGGTAAAINECAELARRLAESWDTAAKGEPGT